MEKEREREKEREVEGGKIEAITVIRRPCCISTRASCSMQLSSSSTILSTAPLQEEFEKTALNRRQEMHGSGGAKRTSGASNAVHFRVLHQHHIQQCSGARLGRHSGQARIGRI
eukprot:scaffold3031_cov285-Pinguiococcus_pyrenoidosus.AAC.4